jgi:ribonucleoside-triphosphate reductase
VESFKVAKGRRLKSIEAHDLMCKVGEVVVVGGVRRSALISLSNLDDFDMAKAKSGQWWETEPQRALANNSAVYNLKPSVAQFLREWRNLYESKSGERGIYNMDSVRKHIDKFGRRDSSKVAGTNPCGEILLRPNQFCNLTEVVISADDTFETLSKKVELATVLGTWQSTLSNFKYIRKSWQANTEEERLLGVSLTGIFGNSLTGTTHKGLGKMLDDLRLQAVFANEKEADLLGIEHSAAITTVKPSGTVSQLVGVSSGIHPWYSEYYIRSVRADNKDPLTMFLKDFGIPFEPDVMKPDATTVFYFPIKAPNNAIVTESLSAIDHLEIWKVYRTHWTEHNPSVTINVKEDEWVDVAAWVYKNFDSIGGVSFLPASEHSYKQAPYQAITKEEYVAALAKMPQNIPWSSLPLYELEDSTTGSQELACVAGACDVADLVSA